MKKLLPFLILTTSLLGGVASAYSTYADFDEDAKPLLRHQKHLLHYVLSHYDVKPIGYAQHPGNDQHPPLPPFIFLARPVDSDGPYTLGLYIADNDPGHILRVFHIHPQKVSDSSAPSAPPTPLQPQDRPLPEQAPTGSPQPTPQETPPPQKPAGTNAPPTSDTPTGPVTN